VAKSGRFANALREMHFQGAQPWEADLMGCANLGFDRRDEMLVQVSCCTSGAPFPWALFNRSRGHWRAALIRTAAPDPSLEIRNGVLHEEIPVYSRGDPMCCASRYRWVTFHPRNHRFVASHGYPSRSSLNAAGLEPARSRGQTAAPCLKSGKRGPATFQILPDVPGPRCLAVHPAQYLSVINKTGSYGHPPHAITVELGPFRKRVPPGQAAIVGLNFGAYLAPGEHPVRVIGAPGPEILVLRH
jgi:hypothetical protein